MTGHTPLAFAATRVGSVSPLQLHLVTVLWGDWYRRMFTDALLPTLLSPGNLPAMAGKVRIKYTIQTSRHDAVNIRNSRPFKELGELTDLSVVVRDDFDPLRVMTTHHRIWNEAREEAIRQKAWLFLLPPDLVCSDGSFAKLAALMTEGKEGVYCNTIRVVSETFVDDLHRTFGTGSSPAVTARPRELLKLALQHYHPLNVAQSHYSRDFSIFEELIHFPVNGEGAVDGFVLCSPISCPFFVVRPGGRYRVSANHVVVEGRDFDGLTFVADSDDMLFLSLLPLVQYRDSYLDHGPMNAAVVSKTALDFDNILARRQAALKYRFHFGSKHGASWGAAEQRATLTMSRIATAREYRRVWKALRQLGYQKAAEFIAAAIYSGRRLPALRSASPATLFVPNDATMVGQKLLRLTNPRNAAQFVPALASYIVPDAIRPADVAGRTLAVRSLAGSTIELDGRGRTVTANGLPLLGEGIDIGPFVFYGIDGVLHSAEIQSNSRPSRQSHAAHALQ